MKRMKPKARKEQVLAAALTLAEEVGYQQVSREKIASRLGISGPAIQYHFKTMGQLLTDVARAAIKQENLQVIAQLIGAKHPRVEKLDPALRRAAMESAI